MCGMGLMGCWLLIGGRSRCALCALVGWCFGGELAGLEIGWEWTARGRADCGCCRPWKLEDVEKHVTQQLTTESVTAVDGSTVKLPVKDYPISVCCHSDSPGCVDIIKTTKAVIDQFNQEHGKG